MSTTDSGTDVEVPEPVPRDDLREGVIGRLTDLLGDAVVATHITPGEDMWARIRADAWAHAAESVRTVLHARYFCFLSAIDWMPSRYGRYLDSEVDRIVHGAEEKPLPPQQPGICGGETRLQLLARVANVADHWGITLKADVPDDDPRIATWTRSYAGADWHERETWEMFGITFEGHPGLRHLYLPGDFEGNPLRKDFPLVTRIVKPWPGIVDVEPMPGAADEPAEGEPAEGEAAE